MFVKLAAEEKKEILDDNGTDVEVKEDEARKDNVDTEAQMHGNK